MYKEIHLFILYLLGHIAIILWPYRRVHRKSGTPSSLAGGVSLGECLGTSVTVCGRRVLWTFVFLFDDMDPATCPDWCNTGLPKFLK